MLVYPWLLAHKGLSLVTRTQMFIPGYSQTKVYPWLLVHKGLSLVITNSGFIIGITDIRVYHRFSGHSRLTCSNK